MTRTRQRPDIPAGYGVSTDGDGMLEWDRVARAMTDAEIYWLSTVTGSKSTRVSPNRTDSAGSPSRTYFSLFFRTDEGDLGLRHTEPLIRD